MAYSPSNPPTVLSQAIAGSKIWLYRSVDAPSLVQVNGYFSDGGRLGMKVGDIVIAQDSDTSPYQTSMASVVTVSSTYPGAVDLSNMVSVGGQSNSD